MKDSIIDKSYKEFSWRLENNKASATALTFIVLILYFLCFIFGQILSLFISTVFIVEPLNVPNSSFTIIELLGSILFILFFVQPLKLNIQKWYLNLSGEFSPVILPFRFFNSQQGYFSIVFYSFIRSIILLLNIVIPFLPSLILISITKVLLNNNYVLTTLSGILIILAILLLIFSIFIAIRLVLNTFFMGTIYNMNIEKNPFKIYNLSRKLTRNEIAKILLILSKIIPYALLNIFIIPIPFTTPIIMSTITGFTKNIIENKNQEVNYVNS